MKKPFAVLLTLVLAQTHAQVEPATLEERQQAQSEVWGFSAPTTNATQMPNFEVTSYHIHLVEPGDQKDGPVGPVLQTLDGQVLTGVMGTYHWCMAADEGTVDVQDLQGRRSLFNMFDSAPTRQRLFREVPGQLEPRETVARVNCFKHYPNYLRENRKEAMPYIKSIQDNRFSRARGPYGDGINRFELVPYRSVATWEQGPAVGTVLFLPSFVGKVLTVKKGKTITHDGYFLVVDTVGRNVLDVFSGYTDGLGKGLAGDQVVWKVEDPGIRETLYRLHCPGVSTPQSEAGWQMCP